MPARYVERALPPAAGKPPSRPSSLTCERDQPESALAHGTKGRNVIPRIAISWVQAVSTRLGQGSLTRGLDRRAEHPARQVLRVQCVPRPHRGGPCFCHVDRWLARDRVTGECGSAGCNRNRSSFGHRGGATLAGRGDAPTCLAWRAHLDPHARFSGFGDRVGPRTFFGLLQIPAGPGVDGNELRHSAGGRIRTLVTPLEETASGRIHRGYLRRAGLRRLCRHLPEPWSSMTPRRVSS
jgi:hypothetical protein